MRASQLALPIQQLFSLVLVYVYKNSPTSVSHHRLFGRGRRWVTFAFVVHRNRVAQTFVAESRNKV